MIVLAWLLALAGPVAGDTPSPAREAAPRADEAASPRAQAPPQPGAAPPTVAVAPEYREELEVLPESERDIEEAKRLFAAGKQAAADNRWDEAIRYFAAAYRYSGSPGQLYSLGRGHRELYFHRGRDPIDLRLALLRFEQYLARSPEGPNVDNARKYVAELRTYAEALEGFGDEVPITRLMIHSPIEGASVFVDDAPALLAPATVDVSPGRHRVRVAARGFHDGEREVAVPEGATVPLEVVLRPRDALLSVQGPDDAEVFVDGTSRGRLPLREPIAVPAGDHQIAVARRGRTPLVRRLALSRGETRSLDADLPLTAQRKAAFVAFGIGGASLVASATLGGVSLQAQREARALEDERRTEGVTEGRFDEERTAWARRDTMRTAAIVTGAAAGVGLATGLVLLLTDTRRLRGRLEPARTPVVAAGLGLGPGGGMVTLRSRFGR